MRVIIAGGRDFTDYPLLKQKVDAILAEKAKSHYIEIVCGEAPGADTLGKRYAAERGYTVTSFPADWDELGKKAGYIRNKQMAEYSDAAICFWDGKSKGTGHMIDLARLHHLLLRIIRY